MKPQDYSRKGIGSAATAIIVLSLLLVSGSVVYFVFVVYPSTTKPAATTGPTNVPGGSTTTPQIQSLGVQWNSFNTLTAATVSETNAQYNFYGYQGKTLSSISSLYQISPAIGSVSKNTQTTYYPTSTDLTGGVVEMSMYAGDNMYTDVSKIIAANSFITNAKWMIVTNTGRLDLVVEISLSKLTVNTAVTPNAAFTVKNNVFSQATLGSATLTNAYTAGKILSISTTANTVTTVKWTLGGLGSNTGAAIAIIAWYDNDSTSAPLLSFVNSMSFGDVQPSIYPGTASGSSAPSLPTGPAQLTVTSGALTIGTGLFLSTGYASATATVNYQAWPGTSGLQNSQLANAIVTSNPANTVGDTTITLPVTSSLAATGRTTVTLSVTLISGAGVLQTALTSAVKLTAASA